MAVVIGAFQRRRYVAHAVESVLAQTLPRAQIEIVVVKDFSDLDLDRWLAGERITTVLSSEARIGRWLLKAVRASHAPLVAFLDDDDEFEPERLAEVVRLFQERPELGYYRNRVRVIDANGRATDPAHWRRLEKDGSFDQTGPIAIAPNAKAGICRLVTEETRVSFNSSTMVVRRELLEGELGAAFDESQLPDLALLIAAAVSPFGLYLDDRRLTRFRFHDENVTHEVAWLHHAVEAHSDLAAVARRLGREDFGQWLQRRSEHFERVYRGTALLGEVRAGRPRLRIASLALDYLRFLGHHPAERAAETEIWAPATVYAPAYLLWPRLGRRLAVVSAPPGRR